MTALRFMVVGALGELLLGRAALTIVAAAYLIGVGVTLGRAMRRRADYHHRSSPTGP